MCLNILIVYYENLKNLYFMLSLFYKGNNEEDINI